MIDFYNTSVPHRADPLYNLTSDLRREEIASVVTELVRHHNQQEAAPPGPQPLFARNGIKDCAPLQAEILYLTTEFVDMLLTKDRLKQQNDKRLIESTHTEMALWGERATEILATYPIQVASYNAHPDPAVPGDAASDVVHVKTGKLIGSIIRLACVTKEKINGIQSQIGDIPSVHMHAAVAYYLHATDTKEGRKPQNKRPVAQEILNDRMQQLRDTDSSTPKR